MNSMPAVIATTQLKRTMANLCNSIRRERTARCYLPIVMGLHVGSLTSAWLNSRDPHLGCAMQATRKPHASHDRCHGHGVRPMKGADGYWRDAYTLGKGRPCLCFLLLFTALTGSTQPPIDCTDPKRGRRLEEHSGLDRPPDGKDATFTDCIKGSADYHGTVSACRAKPHGVSSRRCHAWTGHEYILDNQSDIHNLHCALCTRHKIKPLSEWERGLVTSTRHVTA
jgi:hypothetical protein